MSVEMYREPGRGLCLLVRRCPYIRYVWLRMRLSMRFGLSKHGAPVEGFHRHFQYYTAPGGTLAIGWDLWRGCFVHAVEKETEPLLTEIGAFLSWSGHAPGLVEVSSGSWHKAGDVGSGLSRAGPGSCAPR